MKKNNVKGYRIIFGILTAVVMVCIFLFSCEDSDKSSDTSGRVVKIILKIFYGDFESMTAAEQEEIRSRISHIIRKTAHFTIYAALGFFSSLTVGQRKLISMSTAGVILFCLGYAVTDEIHQYFVPGRACMVTDMLLDTCGGITGIIISFVCMKIFYKRK